MSEVIFQPFHRVLVRNYDTQHWYAAFYSSNDSAAPEFPYRITGGETFKQCIPYNEETAHLLGTADSPAPPEPEFKFGDHVEMTNSDDDSWTPCVFVRKIDGPYPYEGIRKAPWGAHAIDIRCKFCRHADW